MPWVLLPKMKVYNRFRYFFSARRKCAGTFCFRDMGQACGQFFLSSVQILVHVFACNEKREIDVFMTK